MAKDLGTTGFTAHENEFNGNFRGQVVNNSDPLQAGRIQVQVLPMLVNVESALLPWAVPAMPLSSGSGSGYGSFAVPNVGSWVWVFFERGSIYQPVYFAEAVDPTRGIPLFSSENYPNSRGFKTKSGISVVIDDTAVTYTVTHPSGTSIIIDAAGNSTMSCTGNVVISGTTVSINPS